MEGVQQSEVEELRSALTTVTEAMVLFQEFIETEIGEMSYFRDSGSYYKLVDTLDKLRVKALKVPSSLMKQPSMLKPQYRQLTDIDPRLINEIDDEEVEVDVDYTDDDPIDEITIRQVFSVPSPEKDSPENLLKKHNSAITITPVHPEDKKREHQFLFPQSTVMMMDKIMPSQFLSADAPFMVVDNQRVIPAVKLEIKENERVLSANNGTNNLCSSTSFRAPSSIFSSIIAPPKKQKQQKKGTKKSLLKINNPLKKKVGRPATKGLGVPSITTVGGDNLANGTDRPLNLKKKSKRQSSGKPVHCDFCGKSYSSKGVMSRHIKEAHKAEPQFPCFYCSTKFRNGPARLEHMNSSHPEDMNSVTCPYCNRESSSVAGKRNHMMLCARKHQLIVGNPAPAQKNAANNMIVVVSPSDSGINMDVSSSSG